MIVDISSFLILYFIFIIKQIKKTGALVKSQENVSEYKEIFW